ncbi:MAG: Rpn family recombination-promoting nuclease/putative transposase [Parabacteroides sp.]|uniref:Rpn family recombination-promoting nuclease/putative transposase n=1 Tax=Parabacteroides faecalis TaxID=2924040 RepID=A0ABT0C5G4_9BACT|nr:Rpn family recombination-promoting nuclease/putative transposase [Parabacteroides faecalis]MCI7287592.1 Rpn family recombination-promoting nuclease/putative transposase [Parabacteroides sp.]MDY6253583.1 Rpn family recombination-promoting nuclease/putative transposase [Bacteroidales bacterium]MCJ2382249.1 Rpn family recombination-promoting nuclease/putative transposase [Parabacteroides faecalis]MDD6951016.1 Rpn family recombination-promoting nuclease/putative transposase [Parabacteroides sp.]
MEKQSVFINPFVDRGFKILFGQESSKELLIELINDLLEGEHHVEDLSYMDKEDQSEAIDGRGVIFDLLCKDQDGTIFIVELQNAQQDYFYERGLYYLCRIVAGQGRRGAQWEYRLYPVYGIFILNFRSGRTDKVRTDVVWADRETGKPVTTSFRGIYIEMPLFNKKESECETPLDYWLYNLKHMEQLEHLSFKGQKALFARLEELARIANMNKKERDEYEACLKVYRDNYSIALYRKRQEEAKFQEGLQIGKEEGREEGRQEGIEIGEERGILKTARQMKQNGISFEQIKLCTGLTDEEIKNL